MGLSDRIPTAPYTTLAVALVATHRKRVLCVAVHPSHLQPMRDALAEHLGDYRLSIQDGVMRYHEVRERGVVTRWDRDHAYQPVSERLHEVEAAADAFEPMDELEGIAA